MQFGRFLTWWYWPSRIFLNLIRDMEYIISVISLVFNAFQKYVQSLEINKKSACQFAPQKLRRLLSEKEYKFVLEPI